MQALKVIFAVLLFGICALFTLRFYGLSQKYEAYDHPLLKRSIPWVVAWGGEQKVAPSHSLAALRAAQSLNDIFLAVNVQMTLDKHFFILPQQRDGVKGTFLVGGKKVIECTSDEIKGFTFSNGEHPLPLEDFLKQFSGTPKLLWISDNVENIDLRLEPILKAYISGSDIMVHSEYDNVDISLRKLVPQVLYGTGVGQRIRLLMLGSLWLEPVASLDGDFVVTPLKENGVTTVSGAMKTELLRRQKNLILGPLNSIAENDQALNIGAAGYLTVFPSDLKNKLSEKGTGVDLSNSNR